MPRVARKGEGKKRQDFLSIREKRKQPPMRIPSCGKKGRKKRQSSHRLREEGKAEIPERAGRCSPLDTKRGKGGEKGIPGSLTVTRRGVGAGRTRLSSRPEAQGKKGPHPDSHRKDLTPKKRGTATNRFLPRGRREKAKRRKTFDRPRLS